MFAASKTASVSGGYQISRSLRFNSADSAYLNRTPASAGNRQIFTLSCWIKRSALGAYSSLLTVGGSDVMWFTPSDTIEIASAGSSLITSSVYRDVSAWYHVVIAFDTTQATSSNRIKLYINGSQVTSFGTATYPSQNANSGFDSTATHYIGTYPGPLYLFNGYMTEVNFIDGQALTPSSFGETNAQTGVWQPKAYSGSYGTNGFYLNFSDNSNTTAATLGKDYSGNGNNWTPNNFSVTAGVGNDSLVDVPTPYGVDTGVGGTVRGNYATLNPLNAGNASFLFNGNLDLVNASEGAWRSGVSTIAMSTGKWYAEITVTANVLLIGIDKASVNFSGTTTFIGGSPTGWGVLYTGQVYNNSGVVYNNTGYSNGDIIGMTFDADAGVLTWYKNNVAMSQTITGLTSGPYVFGFSANSTGNGSINFGQRPFAYTAPSGYKALCTQNLPTPTIGATTATQAGKYFNPVLYTGNGTTQSITGVGFQPDWTWIKSRNNGSTNNSLYDAVRGAGKVIFTNGTEPEYTVNDLTSFNSDGFSVSTVGATRIETNASGYTYVGWNWKANGAGSTNTSGSITSTVSANTTSGFSVVTYTGLTVYPQTIGHGLGVAPSMIIIKNRSRNGTGWAVYHSALGNTKGILLNSTAVAVTDIGFWNNTTPTSSVFTTGNGYGYFVNAATDNYVAYCFAEVAGYSKFGSYTGNGSSDGPFVFCGFRPAYVMIKDTNNTGGQGNWVIKDDLRAAPYNPQNGNLYANLSNAEDTVSTVFVDLLSNGFKIRGNYNGTNASGSTLIFAAFASAPQKFALAR